jgi:hypothetical protein
VRDHAQEVAVSAVLWARRDEQRAQVVPTAVAVSACHNPQAERCQVALECFVGVLGSIGVMFRVGTIRSSMVGARP